MAVWSSRLQRSERLRATGPLFYILDACQSVGQLPIDVSEIGCDVLSATSRKYLRGPRGAGFLYVRDDLIGDLEPPFLDNHAATWTSLDTYEILPDARRFENWERSYANLLGMDEAARLALELGLPAIWQRVSEVALMLRTALAEIDGVTCTDIGSVKSGIVTFTMAGVDAETVETTLAAARLMSRFQRSPVPAMTWKLGTSSPLFALPSTI